MLLGLLTLINRASLNQRAVNGYSVDNGARKFDDPKLETWATGCLKSKPELSTRLAGLGVHCTLVSR
jgi:hypothetical protein